MKIFNMRALSLIEVQQEVHSLLNSNNYDVTAINKLNQNLSDYKNDSRVLNSNILIHKEIVELENSEMYGQTKAKSIRRLIENRSYVLSEINLPKRINKNDVQNENIDDLTVSSQMFYPNPVHGILNVNLSSYSENTFEIKLYDNIGRLVLTDVVQNEISSFDLSKITKGVYYIKVSILKTHEPILNEKIILQ